MNGLLFVLWLCTTASVCSFVISTVAGTTNGFFGDGGLAKDAQFLWPVNVVLDDSGNIFVSDADNHRIRKIFPNGTIFTIAGSGATGPLNGGFGGDGGPAINAQLHTPRGILVETSGEIIFCDANNHRIRKLFTNGTIATIAGTSSGLSGDGAAAINASLQFPCGIFKDYFGNLFIADTFNNRIRKVFTNGTITTIAGSGPTGPYSGSFSGDNGLATTATLDTPLSVIVDSIGNVLIADSLNHRIRKIWTNGTIVTIAGSGLGGIINGDYGGDGGLATNALMNVISSLWMDIQGNIIFSDSINSRIRRVSTLGIITTLAGDGRAEFTGDGGLAIHSRLYNPKGVFVDSRTGAIYVADSQNYRIRKLSLPPPCELLEL